MNLRGRSSLASGVLHELNNSTTAPPTLFDFQFNCRMYYTSSNPQGQQSATVRQKRYKTSLACTVCRRRKVKCDGVRPGTCLQSRERSMLD